MILSPGAKTLSIADDPVVFLAEKPPANYPTKWIAKQVQVTDSTHNVVCKFLKGTDLFGVTDNNGDDENSQASTPDA